MSCPNKLLKDYATNLGPTAYIKGGLQLRFLNWEPHRWFTPKFRCTHGVWHGCDEKGELLTVKGDEFGWRWYGEVKPRGYHQ